MGTGEVKVWLEVRMYASLDGLMASFQFLPALIHCSLSPCITVSLPHLILKRQVLNRGFAKRLSILYVAKGTSPGLVE